jgi:hypothetical protein
MPTPEERQVPRGDTGRRKERGQPGVGTSDAGFSFDDIPNRRLVSPVHRLLWSAGGPDMAPGREREAAEPTLGRAPSRNL